MGHIPDASIFRSFCWVVGVPKEDYPSSCINGFERSQNEEMKTSILNLQYVEFNPHFLSVDLGVPRLAHPPRGGDQLSSGESNK